MQATTVTMSIFFAGMIAFVPVPSSNYVNVLLMELEHHEQVLVVPLNRLSNEVDCAGLCWRADSLCVCRLRHRAEVDLTEMTAIKIVADVGGYPLPRKPPEELTEANMYAIDWLVSMEHVKPRAAKLDPSRVRGNVGTQMKNFGWIQAATCRFEEAECKVRDEIRRRVFDVEFDDWLNPFDVSQPVAELVVFQATAEPSIAIAYKQKAGGWIEKKLDLKRDAGSYPVLISNSTRSEYNSKELCERCEGDAGRSDHFRAFGLLNGPGRGLPIHRECDSDDYKDLPQKPFPLCDVADIFRLNDEFSADKGLKARFPWATLGDRIICPSAVLTN